jgi:hypothetical protein
MHDVLNRNRFIVKGRMAILAVAQDYDILDPDSGDLLLECREENISAATRHLRLTDFKRITPFDIFVRTPGGTNVVRVKRGVPVFYSRVQVLGGGNETIGVFKQRPVSVNGTFDVLDALGRPVCRLVGHRAGWDFRFLGPDKIELARVTKKWAGLSKELLTRADDYLLEIDEAVPGNSALRQLIIASLMCIDMVVKA